MTAIQILSNKETLSHQFASKVLQYPELLRQDWQIVPR
ncbi:hypothetical protein LINPERPRIM_LOCUS19480 [Linum perenne]